MTILSRAVRNARAMMRAQEWGDSSIPPNSLALPTLGGSATGSEALALSVSTVLACVKVLHDDVSVMPFAAYEGDPRGPHQTVAQQPPIIEEPFGPDVTVAQGMGQVVVSKAMRGNAFLFVVARDALGFETQLAVLHPDKVDVRREKGVKVFKIGGETYTSRDVKHITGLMLPGAIAGMDVLTAQRITFDLAQKVGQYADGFFGSGGSPAGVISVPGAGDRKKAKEVFDNWQAGHAGVRNAHKPAVMFGGATWTPLTVTPENAQFLETRRFLREELCGLFGVPLQRIQAIVENASQGGGKGVDAIDRGYIAHTILPLVAGIESVWSRMLPGGNRSWAAFNVDGFLRAAAYERAQIAQIHRVTGVRTRDEIRADEGWEPLPDSQGANPDSPLNSNAGPTDAGPAPADQGGPA